MSDRDPDVGAPTAGQTEGRPSEFDAPFEPGRPVAELQKAGLQPGGPPINGGGFISSVNLILASNVGVSACGFLIVVVNLITDLSYGLIDPRVKQ